MPVLSIKGGITRVYATLPPWVCSPSTSLGTRLPCTVHASHARYTPPSYGAGRLPHTVQDASLSWCRTLPSHGAGRLLNVVQDASSMWCRTPPYSVQDASLLGAGRLLPLVQDASLCAGRLPLVQDASLYTMVGMLLPVHHGGYTPPYHPGYTTVTYPAVYRRLQCG